MAELSILQLVLIGLIFVWSGFVRSGLGFGGAVLSLPFLLLVKDDPLLFLPIIAIQLLLFSALILHDNYRQQLKLQQEERQSLLPGIDGPYLFKALKIMIVPKMIGVLGLLTLRADILSGIIFCIVIVYAVSYILNRPFQSNHVWLDNIFLMLGGYVSGTSLIGAPLIVTVFATHVSKEKLRDTLFVLWFILVLIKLTAFVMAGVDLQLKQQLWLLPCAAVGHVIGLRFHRFMLSQDSTAYFRFLGAGLILVCTVGLWQIIALSP